MFHRAHSRPSVVWLKAQTDILRVQSEECRMQSEKRTAETAKGPQIAQIVRINAEGGLAEKRQRQGKPREPNDRNTPAACRGMKRRNPQSGWRPAGDGQALKLPLTAEHAENAEGDLGEKRQQQQRQAHAETRRTRRKDWAKNGQRRQRQSVVQPEGLRRKSLGQRPRLRGRHAPSLFVQPEGLGRDRPG
jgi:hypothetical protein